MLNTLSPQPAPTQPDRFAVLVAAAEHRFGLKVQPIQAEALRDGLASLLTRSRLSSVEALAEHVRRAAATDEHLRSVQSLLTVGETYLFRAPKQLEALAAMLASAKRIRAWSAACATGEEAYSLAIVLKAAAPRAQLEVLGTDVNEASLRAAERGEFRPRAIRGPVPDFARDSLRRTGTGWAVSAEVRKVVRFARVDLQAEALELPPGAGTFDVVLLRNVLFYFQPEQVGPLIRRVAHQVAPGGILGITAAEYRAAAHLEGFEPRSHALVVRSRGKTEPARPAAAVSGGSSAGWEPPSGPSNARVPGLHEAAGALGSGAALHREEQAGRLWPAVGGEGAQGTVGAASSPPGTGLPFPLGSATSPRWAELPQAPAGVDPPLGGSGDASALLARARTAADANDLQAARALVDRALLVAPDSAEAYHLSAVISVAAGDSAAAIGAFQRTLFLDRGHAASALGLGRALAQVGRHAEAQHQLRRAERLFRLRDPSELIAELGLRAESAARLAAAELERVGDGR